jgi:BlaI family penicillinase repressor
MNSICKIPDSELEIMMVIWDADAEVTSDYIMEHLDKAWMKTTVLNFLSRLCDRGFLSCTKKGRQNIYSAQVKKEDYLKRESRSFLQKLYHGSLTGLVASLYDGKIVSKEELEKLKRFIEEAK